MCVSVTSQPPGILGVGGVRGGLRSSGQLACGMVWPEKQLQGQYMGWGGSEQDKKAGNGKGRNIDEPEKPGFGLGQA